MKNSQVLQPFNRNQIKNDIGNTLLAVSGIFSEHKDSNHIGVAIELPDNADHRKIISEIEFTLKNWTSMCFGLRTNTMLKLCLLKEILMKSVQMVIDVFVVELDDLNTYAERIKAFLSELDQEIERALEGLSHDKKDDLFHEKYSETFHQLDRSFPSILIKSLFISTYSTLEVCLDRLCNVIHKTNGFPIEPKDLAGDGIFRSKAYLIKVARIDFPEGLNPWQKILHMNKLRNHYEHNGSNYVGLNSPVHKAAKAFKSISIEDTFRIEEKEVGITITHEFCIETIELMQEFLKDLRTKL